MSHAKFFASARTYGSSCGNQQKIIGSQVGYPYVAAILRLSPYARVNNENSWKKESSSFDGAEKLRIKKARKVRVMILNNNTL